MEIKELLNRITSINIKYSDIAKITGENYNIFRILKVEASEVRLHSAFLANLLNPHGSHERGNVFVIEFVKLLNEKIKKQSEEDPFANLGKIDFDSTNVTKTEVEHWLGYNTESEGGYIDILLIDKNDKKIIIENKIYAGDQENQLLRYHNFDTYAPIVYLTLDGKLPSEFSTNKSTPVYKNLICISYKNDILTWLEGCKKHTVDYPLLRETLTQYIVLIKHLTNQAMNNELEKEITNTVLLNPEWIEAAQKISILWERGDIKDSIMKDVIASVKEKFAKEPEINLGFKNLFGRKDSGLEIYKNGWKNCIYFYFLNEFYTLWIGIAPINDELGIDGILKDKIYQNLSAIKFGKVLDRDDWVWVSDFDEWDDIAWKDVRNEFPDAIYKATDKILHCIKDVEM